MGVKRPVDTSFWIDGKVDEFTPEDKYFMLYLLTNPFTTQLGIYEISIKHAAFQMGYSVESVQALIERFESKYKIIIFSPETSEIAIKNFLCHSIIKGGKPVEDCINKEILKVKNKNLIDVIFRHISRKDNLNQTVKKIITDYFNKNNIEIDNKNDNDNDNDNERIVNESSITDFFKSLCPSFSTIQVISTTMKKDIAESLKQYNDEQIKAAFTKAEQSSFLKGKNERKWKASFAWLIKAENIAKVLNGQYDDQSDTSSRSYDLEAYERMTAEKVPVYASSSPELQARADALRQEFSEGSV